MSLRLVIKAISQENQQREQPGLDPGVVKNAEQAVRAGNARDQPLKQ